MATSPCAHVAVSSVDPCTEAWLRCTATHSVQRWPAHWRSIVQHQPPAGRDMRCLATTLSATRTAVYSAVPGTAEPGLPLHRRQLCGHLLSAPHVTQFHASRQTNHCQLPHGAISSWEAARHCHELLGLPLVFACGCCSIARGGCIVSACYWTSLHCRCRRDCSCMHGVKWLLWICETCLVRATARSALHNSLQHSEITTLWRLWLCSAAALDETNNRVDKVRSVTNLLLDRNRMRFMKIGTESESVLRSVRSLTNTDHTKHANSNHLLQHIYISQITDLLKHGTLLQVEIWVATSWNSKLIN